MLKLLLIIVITAYVLSKIGRLLFGVRMYSSQNQRHQSRPPGSNVDVDANPPRKNKSSIKGGEYIDYEEVK